MKKLLPFLLLFVLAGAGLWAFTLRHDDEGLVLSGIVEARDTRVGSLVGGRVLAVHAEEGDTVGPGDPLVTLDVELLALESAQQEATVREAEARLLLQRQGPRQEEVERARLEWKEAETEARRLGRLHAEGVISRSALDAQATTAGTARERLLELQRGARPEDVAAAEAALSREREKLAHVARRLEESVVRSPVSARVQALDVRPGDIVAPNQPVAELVETGQVWVRLFVPETQLGLVSVGQRVAISVDSFPERTFEGRIASIRDRAEFTPRNVQTLDQRADQVFGLRVDVEGAPELKPGMAATARLAAPDAP